LASGVGSFVNNSDHEERERRENALRTARVPPVKNPEMMALYGSAIGCGILLGVFEGVGVLVGRCVAFARRLQFCLTILIMRRERGERTHFGRQEYRRSRTRK
jgi:hypothetical protein